MRSKVRSTGWSKPTLHHDRLRCNAVTGKLAEPANITAEFFFREAAVALGPIAANLETAQRAAHFPWLARTLAIRSKALVGDADAWIEANAPAPVQRILKAQVAAGTTLDPEWGGAAAGDYKNTVAAFVDSLRTASIYFRLLSDNGFVRVPLQRRVAITTATASGWIVGEGKPVPLSRLSLQNQLLQPHRAAALIVVTDELVGDVSAAGQALFVRELEAQLPMPWIKSFSISLLMKRPMPRSLRQAVTMPMQSWPICAAR